jgi:hypothetical protein
MKDLKDFTDLFNIQNSKKSKPLQDAAAPEGFCWLTNCSIVSMVQQYVEDWENKGYEVKVVDAAYWTDGTLDPSMKAIYGRKRPAQTPEKEIDGLHDVLYGLKVDDPAAIPLLARYKELTGKSRPGFMA